MVGRRKCPVPSALTEVGPVAAVDVEREVAPAELDRVVVEDEPVFANVFRDLVRTALVVTVTLERVGEESVRDGALGHKVAIRRLLGRRRRRRPWSDN